MLSKEPINFEKVKKENVDKEILRLGMIAELDAVNLYEQLAATTENENMRKMLLDIAKEEKTHMGEFQALLLKLDKEQVEELEEGRKEVEEKQNSVIRRKDRDSSPVFICTNVFVSCVLIDVRFELIKCKK